MSFFDVLVLIVVYFWLYGTIILGLVIHILALIASHYSKKYSTVDGQSPRQTLPIFLFKSLLTIDFSALIVSLMQGILRPIFRRWEFFCDVSIAASIYFLWISGFLNILMFLDRCLVLMAPYTYTNVATLAKAKMVVTTLVIGTFGLCCLPMVGFGSYKIKLNGTYKCVAPGDLHLVDSKTQVYFTWIFLLLGLVIMCSILLGNSILIYKVLQWSKSKPVLGEVNSFTRSTTDGPSAASTSIVNAPERGTKLPESFPKSGEDLAVRDDSKRNPRIVIGSAKKTNEDRRHIIVLIVVSVAYMVSLIPFYVSFTHQLFVM